MKKLKVGVIGAGSISSMHMDAYAKNRGPREDEKFRTTCPYHRYRIHHTALPCFQAV
jgi:predicted dehydrogenase